MMGDAAARQCLAPGGEWFDRAKGYGFVCVGGKMDVFVHMETLRKSGIAVLQEGERLRVVVTDGSKGKHAVWVGRAV